MVGDPVNMAQRLQALSKDIGPPDQDVKILVGDATAQLAAADPTLRLSTVGRHALRGISIDQEVYRLYPANPAEAAALVEATGSPHSEPS